MRMRWLRPLLLVVTLAACAHEDRAEQAAALTAASGAAAYLPIVERVADRVHVMRQAAPNFAGVVGNVTIIEQSDSIVLVDSGNNRGWGERVVAAVRRISDKPVSAVIVTHWHNDHPLGLPAIVAAWPDVEIIATNATRSRLAAGSTNVPTEPSAEYEARRHALLTQDYVELTETNANDASLSHAERDGWRRARDALDVRVADEPGTYLVMPTRMFDDVLRLEDRTAPIEIRFLGRANTDGDLIVWLPRQRVLAAGDIVVAPVPYMFSMYPREQIEVLERIKAYDFAVLVPGHGEIQRDARHVDLTIALIAAVRAQTAALVERGVNQDDAAAQIEVSDLTRQFTGEDPWLRYWFNGYALEPLIASAYREAAGTPGPP